MIVFYCFLLFGPEVHDLWASFDDTTYNILALVTFGFCLVEIGLRILVEPHYFQFGMPTCGSNHNKFGHTIANDNNSSCAMGSFLFWCDLVSMGVILLDVSWINRSLQEQRTVEIDLDSLGFPVRFPTKEIKENPSGCRRSILCVFLSFLIALDYRV